MASSNVWELARDLLPTARLWRRISTTKFDDEIQQTVAAGLLDLRNAGVVNVDIEDALVQQALKFYLKSHFGDDADADKWGKAYEHLKAALSLSGDYSEVTVYG